MKLTFVKKFVIFLYSFWLLLYFVTIHVNGSNETELITRSELHQKEKSISSRKILQRKKPPKGHSRINCTCGVKYSDPFKVVGGKLAEENEWPWVVALVYTEQYSYTKKWQVCGASLINSQYLLTASHCTLEMQKEGLQKYQAYLGSNSLSDSHTVRASLSQIKMHPRYNKITQENDIALVKLSKPVRYSKRIQPICLTQSGSPFVGVSGVVSGWGAVRTGGGGVNRLREAKVKVLNNRPCARNYSRAKVRISGHMMCAGLPNKDACQGDSGGPLVHRNSRSRSYSQIGIVSFGFECGSVTYPGIYTRVSSYIKWIKDNTRDAVYCPKSF